ncbi:hypothetical protein ACIA59_20050 [Micromonospora haikouensis]|uniref:hypothetical protein n=1 Tax=Micromonospora haikouensis TaxID=686309 RepID=UPI0037A54E05
MVWRFWRRRRQCTQVDQTGPATVYERQTGAYTASGAPWHCEPTEIMPTVPMTRGHETTYGRADQ